MEALIHTLQMTAHNLHQWHSLGPGDPAEKYSSTNPHFLCLLHYNVGRLEYPVEGRTKWWPCFQALPLLGHNDLWTYNNHTWIYFTGGWAYEMGPYTKYSLTYFLIWTPKIKIAAIGQYNWTPFYSKSISILQAYLNREISSIREVPLYVHDIVYVVYIFCQPTLLCGGERIKGSATLNSWSHLIHTCDYRLSTRHTFTNSSPVYTYPLPVLTIMEAVCEQKPRMVDI